MTRPTDWTMSTTDLRGDRNITASSAGTSTPSDRQRALVRMRHAPSGTSPRSQSSRLLRSRALNVPSTCWISHVSTGSPDASSS